MSPILAAALACAVANSDLPPAARAPIWLDRRVTAEDLAFVVRHYGRPPKAGHLKDGTVAGLYFPGYRVLIAMADDPDYPGVLYHEACHHLQYEAGRPLDEAQCNAVQRACR